MNGNQILSHNYFTRLFPKIIFLSLASFCVLSSFAQDQKPASTVKKQDTLPERTKQLHLLHGHAQVDVFDIINHFLSKQKDIRRDTSKIKTGKFYASLLPSVEYTLQTGF